LYAEYKEVSMSKLVKDAVQERNCNQEIQAFSRKELGKIGEDMACLYLQQGGAKILERNWKCKSGEADLIVQEDSEIVFVEVKTRRSISAGFPEEAITAAKRARYEKIALHFLASRDLPSARIRFDVIAVSLLGEHRSMLRHHRDAFGVGI
jgi:putative endonuclease